MCFDFGFLDAGFCFVELIEVYVGVNQVGVVDAIGDDFHRVVNGSERFWRIAELCVKDGEIGGRNFVVGISARPSLVGGSSSFEITGDEIRVVRVDVELFAFAGAIAKLVGLGQGFGGLVILAHIEIVGAEACVGHGEIGIELSGADEERNGGGEVSIHDHRFVGECVGLEGLEGCGGDVFTRGVVFLEGGERFAEFLADF